MFDHSKLRGRMRECGFTQTELAKEAEMSSVSLCDKLGGKIDFKQKDIYRISNILEIEPKDIPAYFFTLKV